MKKVKEEDKNISLLEDEMDELDETMSSDEKDGEMPGWRKAAFILLIAILSFFIGNGLSRLSNNKTEDSIAAQAVNAILINMSNENNAEPTEEKEEINTENKSAEAEHGTIYVPGYNEELTKKAYSAISENVYSGCGQIEYSKELTAACKDGSIESSAVEIAREHDNGSESTFISCQMDGGYDDERLIQGLNNGSIKKEGVTNFWVGVIANSDGCSVYIMLEQQK